MDCMTKRKVTVSLTDACEERIEKIATRYGMTVPSMIAQLSEALSWIRPECYFNVIGEIQQPEFLAARPGRPSKSSHPETETSQPAQASAN
jgi:hypothetical protein